MNFKLDPYADYNLTSHRATLSDITVEMMLQTFGAPPETADYDPYKGYTRNRWYLTSDDGQVTTVYQRWSELHVGAHSDAIVEPFVAWIRSEVQSARVRADVAQEQTRLRTEKLLAEVAKEDKYALCEINDSYLFPEYLGRELDLTWYYPMLAGGGRYGLPGGLQDIDRDAGLAVQKLGKYWKDYRHMDATGTYQDDRVCIQLLREAMARTRVYIISPAQAKERTWRLVLAIELRAGSRRCMTCKPGKWILYMHDLAQR